MRVCVFVCVGCVCVCEEKPVLLQMKEVTLKTPGGHAVLVERLSFQLRQGRGSLKLPPARRQVGGLGSWVRFRV